MGARERPSLWRPSLFALTWHFSVLLGFALIALAVVRLISSDVPQMGWPLVVVASLVFLGELRPVIASQVYVGSGVAISSAFVFAALYLWGFAPAIMLEATAILIAELMMRKELWKLLFNIGQYVISLSASWLVLYLAGVTTTPSAPRAAFHGSDAWWVLLSWLVYHLVNLSLVAGTAESDGQTWWESFSEDFWYYTFSTLSVLAVSPFIVVMASVAWQFVPLLLLPLVAVWKTAEISRDKERQAMHDALTDLPNRTLLQHRVGVALELGRREGTGLGLILLDLDRFKEVNDTLGHPAGDALLEAVSYTHLTLPTILRV